MTSAESTDDRPSRLYLDHAATGWPKPPEVYAAMDRYAREGGASAGRGLYRSAAAADQVVASCRRRLAQLLGVSTAQHIAFFANGTAALNAAILGCLQPGDHVVTTAIEHNSVLRPLHWLQQQIGIELEIVPCDAAGEVAIDQLAQRLRPQTRLVALSHASNVTGRIQPLAEVAALLTGRPTLLLCDAAQTLGYVDIDMRAMGIDLLAAPGHKGGQGPLGTALLAASPKGAEQLRPTLFGGTGSQSQSLEMPGSWPAMLEPGNLNVPALAGWEAGLAQWQQAAALVRRESLRRLAIHLWETAMTLPDCRVIGGQPTEGADALPLVSLVFGSIDVATVAALLDAEFSIEVRAGLHCAGLIHPYLGTAAEGTLRVSGGHGTTLAEIDRWGAAMREILGG